MARIYRRRGPKRARKVARGAKKMPYGRRRLLPGASAAATGAFIYWAGRKIYEGRRGYKTALAKKNAARQARNLDVSKNIVKIPAGLTVGTSKKMSLKSKIEDSKNRPIYFRQTHAYKINADSGRMNWFYTTSLSGGTMINMINKVKDSSSDANTANTVITDPTVAIGTNGVPQQFYKYLVDYNSVQYQMMNSSTNSLQGVIMWVKPKRELPTVFPGSSVPVRPCNIYAMALNSAIPTQNVYNPTNYTQSGATAGFITASLTVDYNRGGNTGTTNNTGDNVLELDVGLKPTSSCVSNIFDYYFDVVKSTDFDLSPGQQAEFWLKQNDANVLDFQALNYDSVPNLTYFCMIGIKGQMVGTNAATGDVNVVSTGSAQLSIIETHKTIVKAHTVEAPKIWNFISDAGETAPGGVLAQIADANQEIVNDETDGIDNSYNEVV